MHNSVLISNKIKISWAERLGSVCCFSFYLKIHTYLSCAHNTSNFVHTPSIIEADILEILYMTSAEHDPQKNE